MDQNSHFFAVLIHTDEEERNHLQRMEQRKEERGRKRKKEEETKIDVFGCLGMLQNEINQFGRMEEGFFLGDATL